jgi:hypothetical protein
MVVVPSIHVHYAESNNARMANMPKIPPSKWLRRLVELAALC